MARNFKSIHPTFEKYSSKKKLTAKQRAELKNTANQFAAMTRKYGAGGFKILRTKKAYNAAKKAKLTIGKFKVIKLNSYVSDKAPLKVSSDGNVITQRAVHKYNSHMRLWHYHRVIVQRATSKNKNRNDIIISAFERELMHAKKEMQRQSKRKCIGIFLWGPLGILYNHQAGSIDTFLEYIRSWLNSSVSGRELDTDNLLGFAWASHPCDKPISFPNSPKRLKKGRITRKEKAKKKWRKVNATGRN